jgi:DNA modification methylase
VIEREQRNVIVNDKEATLDASCIAGVVRNLSAVLEPLARTRAKGQTLDRPWIHTFAARMPTSIAEYLIENFTAPGATVLDPMAGSGTTLVAAKRLGRRAIGFDRDPMAVLIAKSAMEELPSAQLNFLKNRILARAIDELRLGKIGLGASRSVLAEEDQRFIRYWFPSVSQKQLFALAASIAAESNKHEQQLAWVVFSNLIIAKSAGASFALDISRSRPHKRKDKPVKLPFDDWNRRFKQVILRLPFLDHTESKSQESLLTPGDARSLPLQNATVDLVLTSPPYVNAIDYLRTHKFSLVWMGYRLEHLRELRGTMVGTERGLWSLDGLPDALEQQITQKVKIKRRRAILRRYLSDLQLIFREINRVLKPGGLAVLVLGPTIINTKRTDVVQIALNLGNRVGLKVIGSVERALNQVRRSLPPPSAANQISLSKRMRREIIVVLHK